MSVVYKTPLSVLPALKATGKSVQARLQTLTAGGGSRMQMGPLWTMLIVAQVAVTVSILPAAMFFTWDGLRLRAPTAGFASDQVLFATATLDRSSEPTTAADDGAFNARFAAAHAMLDEALRADSAVVDVTYSLRSPGGELAMVLEAEDQALPADPVDYSIVEGSRSGHLARYNRVAPNYFDVFGVPALLGRTFTAADLGTDHVIINRTLANQIFGGGNPLERRVKYVGASRETGADAMPLERWFEIIGVIPDFPDNELVADLCIYHPAAPGAVNPATLAVRVRAADPATYMNALRTVAAAVNPNLQVRDMSTIAMDIKREQSMFRMIGATVGLVMLSVIILSAAGIYSLMSFTVARRRREIGIRAALGADRRRLLAGIFSRVFAQLGAGAALGVVGWVAVGKLLQGELIEDRFVVLVPLVALVMIVVGVLAALGPARQGLGIQPTEALRED